MKNANNTTEQSFSELLATGRLTKETLHEAIETVAAKFAGFKSTAYSLTVSSTGFETLDIFAHFHGGKCYMGQGKCYKDEPAIEAVSSALVMLNNAILNDFNQQAAENAVECSEIQDHAGHNITDAFLSENETADLRTEYAA